MDTNKFHSLSPSPTYHPSLTSMSSSPPTPDSISHHSTPITPSPSVVYPPSPAGSNVVVSQAGMIHVLGYTPTEGERGVPITVRIHFHPELAEAVYVRLVVGNKAVATKVKELPGTTYGRWQLDAIAPPLDHTATSTKALISIQAINESEVILDSVTFGEFSYWTPTTQNAVVAPVDYGISNHTRSKDNKPLSATNTPALRRRSLIQLDAPASTSSTATNGRNKKTKLHRRLKSQTLIRSKFGTNGENEDAYLQTPILDLVTPLPSLCVGWTAAEINAGRRLVRFGKIQEGRRLIVSCEPISQDEYCESDSVISCIFREETKNCFVTSVDIIYLLERLTNDEFPVEEKNRIRRNLEGLRPTTVSKHKTGFENFFQKIMEFPDPKPRNIEKDLKVFEWTLLGQALEKILSKYSIYTTAQPDYCDSEQSSIDAAPSPKSPEFMAPADFSHHTNYPDTATNHTTLARLDVSPEALSLFHPDSEGSYHSPATSISTASSFMGVAPSYLNHNNDTTTRPVSNWSAAASSGTTAHTAEFKSNDLAFDAYGNLASFDTIDSGALCALDAFSDHPTYSLPYDHYAYQTGLQDDALAGIVEPYL